MGNKTKPHPWTSAVAFGCEICLVTKLFVGFHALPFYNSAHLALGFTSAGCAADCRHQRHLWRDSPQSPTNILIGVLIDAHNQESGPGGIDSLRHHWP